MRSTRPTTWRSPTSSSSAASAASQASEAAAARMSSGSEASGRTNVVGCSPARSRAQSRKSWAHRSVWKPQASVRGHAAQQLAHRDVRQRLEPHRRRERRVAEVHGGEVGPGRPEPLGHQAQVVVLHEHRRALGRRGRDGVGEGVVDLAVGVPGLGPAGVEGGLPGEVPEAVVGEPQHAVAHDVVGQAVRLGIEGDELHPEARRPPPRPAPLPPGRPRSSPPRARWRRSRRRAGRGRTRGRRRLGGWSAPPTRRDRSAPGPGWRR